MENTTLYLISAIIIILALFGFLVLNSHLLKSLGGKTELTTISTTTQQPTTIASTTFPSTSTTYTTTSTTTSTTNSTVTSTTSSATTSGTTTATTTSTTTSYTTTHNGAYYAGKSITNITYCNGQVMGIFYPTNQSLDSNSYPVIIMVHGGAFQIGNGNTSSLNLGSDNVQLDKDLVSNGFVVAKIDYRLAPEYKFPDPVEDVKCSIRYLKANAGLYAIDPNRIGLLGDSAGSYLVALAGLTPNNQWDVGPYLNYSSSVNAVSTWAATTNLTQPWDFGSIEEGLAEWNVTQANATTNVILLADSPVTYVKPNEPPYFILAGTADNVISDNQSVELYNLFAADGNKNSKLLLVLNATHDYGPGYVNGIQLGPIYPNGTAIKIMQVNFLRKYVGGNFNTNGSAG